jgi:hypothetical protein
MPSSALWMLDRSDPSVVDARSSGRDPPEIDLGSFQAVIADARAQRRRPCRIES